jgi:hypothetical protein
MLIRQLLIAVVTGALLCPAAFPTAPQVVGVAGPSKGATVAGAGLQQGTNVANGDIVEVGEGGEGVVTLGHNAMARFGEKSAVRVYGCDRTKTLELLRGRMTYRTTSEQPVEGRIGDAIIRSADGQDAVGIVTLQTPTTATITAEKGTLTVNTADGKSAVVRPGETAQVALSLSTQARRPTPLCGIVLADVNPGAWTTAVIIGGTTVLGVGIALSSNEKKPTCPQKQALVSPFVFPCP